ncbi:hypothetical protein OQI89_14665 [Lentilactobacillus diolivorans]|uniref:hypothetical protein n=1 Tax=Lentilactobacillus diolivorans TaxID=179838 RepID=UPI0024692C65|nr:hypothetical protein [Lentilactobacillus diolivorans]MDH5107074.1 hypothetical protein [Lentilactobacillus diolivorans]
MLFAWMNDNYWKIVTLLIVFGILFFAVGMLFGGFNFQMFNYPGNLETRPWYWFLGF